MKTIVLVILIQLFALGGFSFAVTESVVIPPHETGTNISQLKNSRDILIKVEPEETAKKMLLNIPLKPIDLEEKKEEDRVSRSV